MRPSAATNLTKRHMSFTCWKVTEDALSWIHWGGSTGRLAFTADARARMAARHLSVADVRHALLTATKCTREDMGFRVESLDLESNKLSMHVIIEERVIVLELL